MTLLKTGQTPDFDFVGSGMAEVVKGTAALKRRGPACRRRLCKIGSGYSHRAESKKLARAIGGSGIITPL
jgi:hypothetical protein